VKKAEKMIQRSNQEFPNPNNATRISNDFDENDSGWDLETETIE
jgi:hypothetical protein